MLYTCDILVSCQLRVIREIQSWETSWMLTHLNSSHSSHTQPLHYSHLNTGYLIAEIQANLARNKANTWLNKFNLTISFFGYYMKNPKLDSRLKMWVGNSCQNSLTSNSRNYEALEPYEQVFPENNCKASIINSIKSYTTSTKSSGLSQS